MKELLKSNEFRRLKLIEVLAYKSSWTTTNELANEVNSSKRVIKNDISYLREKQDIFDIESSYKGIKINFKQEKNIKDFYQKNLKDSVSFNALEFIFFNSKMTSETLSDHLFISESTLYRLVREIDTALSRSFNISLNLNTYELIGSEQSIRYFYYLYFSEKYANYEWPFKSINEAALDELLNFFIEFSQIKMNYAYYRNFKLVTAVNLTRYMNGNLIEYDSSDTNFSDLITDSTKLFNTLRPIFNRLSIELTLDSILQLFYNYVRKDFALNYDRLIHNAQQNQNLLDSVNFISNFLDDTSEKFDVSIENKEELIWHISKAAYNEGFEAHSGYILYNRNELTLKEFKTNFSDFYEHIAQGMFDYRLMINKPFTKFSINHLIFQVFVCWNNLLPQLQNKWEKIKILLISDINNGHSNLIKDQIEYSFNNKIFIEVFEEKLLTIENIAETGSDLIISTFSIPVMSDIPIVCLSNIPTQKDLKLIDKILEELIINKQSNNFIN